MSNYTKNIFFSLISFLFIFMMGAYFNNDYADNLNTGSLFINNVLLRSIQKRNFLLNDYSESAPIISGYYYRPIWDINYASIDKTTNNRSKKEIEQLNLVISKLNPNVSSYQRHEIAKYILRYTKHLSWPTPQAVASVIYIESTFYPNVVSYGGCFGLMQLSPTWRNKIPNAAFNDIKYNIKYGVKLLRANYVTYHGNKFAALLVYNSGPVAYDRGYAPRSYYWRYKEARKHINDILTTT
jgi:soluble lytic murein transglycosylase-like protein